MASPLTELDPKNSPLTMKLVSSWQSFVDSLSVHLITLTCGLFLEKKFPFILNRSLQYIGGTLVDSKYKFRQRLNKKPSPYFKLLRNSAAKSVSKD